MVKTLTRHGDSLALVLDEQMLDALGLNGASDVSVTVSGNCLVVGPVADESRRQRFDDAKRDTFDRYDDVFRRLAE